MFKNAKKFLTGVMCGAVMISSMTWPVSADIPYPGKQNQGQMDAQIKEMNKSLSDWNTVRTFTGERLNKYNLPIGGMGTGALFFDGDARINSQTVGSLENTYMLTSNSLFAISINNNGKKTTKVLQGKRYLADTATNAFQNQPCNLTRSGVTGKQGTYMVSSNDLSPFNGPMGEKNIGAMNSNTFTVPENCTQVSLLMGGGANNGKCYFALMDAQTNRPLIKLINTSSLNGLSPRTMTELSAYAGRSVYFQIADWDSGDGWAHILIDDIKMKDSSGKVLTVPGFTNGDFETGDQTGWSVVANESLASSYYYDKVTATPTYLIGRYDFTDASLPVSASLEMFSPMVPLNEKSSTVPAAIFNVTLKNTSAKAVDVSILSSLANALQGQNISNTATSDAYGAHVFMKATGAPAGTIADGAFCLQTSAPGASYSAGAANVNALIDQMKANGTLDNTSTSTNPVGGVCAPVTLAPGESKTVSFTWTWYFPYAKASDLANGYGTSAEVGRRYAEFYTSVEEVMKNLVDNKAELIDKTIAYRDTLYDSNLPYYLLDAVSSTSDVLSSPTFFLTKSGDPYAWEGSGNTLGYGLGTGNAQHVWTYQETLSNLYPTIAQRWRTQDLTKAQIPSGLLNNRLSAFPAPNTPPVGQSVTWDGTVPAIDGGCLTIASAYKEYLYSKDKATFLDGVWPNIKKAMEAIITAYDPNEDGINENSDLMTLDSIMGGEYVRTTGLYHLALRATEEMAKVEGDTAAATRYHNLFVLGSEALDKDTYNGEYYIQADTENYTGPSSEQYWDHSYLGDGVLTDQLLGQSQAYQYGLGDLLPQDHIRQANNATFKYNFSSPYGVSDSRPGCAPTASQAGTRLATWPNGGKTDRVKFLDEDMSGFTYPSAILNIYNGNIQKALTTVHALRYRYDGVSADPLNESEFGSYYGRDLVTYGLLTAATGITKDVPNSVLSFHPNMLKDDIKAFFTYDDGWGTFEQKQTISGSSMTQTDAMTVKYGSMDIKTLNFSFPDVLAESASNITATVTIDDAAVASTSTVNGNQVTVELNSKRTVHDGSAIKVVISLDASTEIAFSDNFSGGDFDGWHKPDNTYTDTSTWFNNDTQMTGIAPVGGYNFLMRDIETGRDFTYNAVVTPSGNSGGGLAFRTNKTASEGYGVYIDKGSNQVKLIKLPGTVLGSAPIANASSYTLTVKAQGSSIKVFVGGATTPVIDVTDSSYASGSMGILAYNGTVIIDDVLTGDAPKPSIPQHATATLGVKDYKTCVDVNWTYDPSAVNGYSVYRSVGSADGPYDKISTSPILTASFVDSDISPNTVYYYKITSSNNYFESEMSAYASVRAGEFVKPAAPTDVIAKAGAVNKKTAVTVFWNGDPLAKSNVYRCDTGADGVYTKVNSLPITGSSFVDDSIPTEGVTYYYRVTTLDGLESDYSLPGSVSVDTVFFRDTGNLTLSKYWATPIDGTWDMSGGVITGNAGSNSDGKTIFRKYEKVKDFVYEADITRAASCAAVLAFGSPTNSEGFHTYMLGADNFGTTFKLYKFNTGYQVIQSVPCEWLDGTTHRVKVEKTGNTFKCYMDSELMFTVTDTTFTDAGYVGLSVYGSGSNTFDNVALNKLNPVTAVTVSAENDIKALNDGDTLQMRANVLPTAATYPNVIWSVANEDGTSTPHASINAATGMLSALSPGAVTVTATANDGSGKTDTYTVTILGEYKTGLTEKTSVQTFVAAYAEDGLTAEVYQSDKTTPVTSGNVGTGMIVMLYSGGEKIGEHVILLYGDVDGDGQITALDMLGIKKHILKKKTLEGVYLMAGDADHGDDGATVLDMLGIKKHILKIKAIDQTPNPAA